MPHYTLKRALLTAFCVVLAVWTVYTFYHNGIKKPIKECLSPQGNEKRTGDFWSTFPPPFVDSYNPALRSKTIVIDWYGRTLWGYGPVQHFATVGLTFFRDIRLVGLVWLFINYLILGASLALIFSALQDRIPRAPLTYIILAVWLNFWPLFRALEENVIEVFELFLIILSLNALMKGKEIVSGTAMGIAAMTKFLPVIFLPYFLVKKRFRAFLAMALTLIVIALFTQVSLGWEKSEMLQRFVKEIKEDRYDYTYWRSQTIASAIERLCSASDYSTAKIYNPSVKRPALARRLVKSAVALVGIPIFLLLFRGRDRKDIYPLEFALLSLSMILLVTHGEHYYPIFALIGYSTLGAYLYTKRDAFLITLGAISYALSSILLQLREFDMFLKPDLNLINREIFFHFLSFPTYGGIVLLGILMRVYAKGSRLACPLCSQR